jgi:hypothetical protein
MKSGGLKNNSIKNQYLKRNPQHILSSSPVSAAYFRRCSHGDRVINRHSGERAAYGSRVWLSRRAETLSHVPPGLRTLYRSVPCASPGKKPFQGAWRATLSISSKRQDHAPWTSPGISMARPETGRGNEEAWHQTPRADASVRTIMKWRFSEPMARSVARASQTCAVRQAAKCAMRNLERVPGIEPGYSAWKAAALPLSYTRADPEYTIRAAEGRWWEMQDSNLRRRSQRIYSPPPLPLGTISRNHFRARLRARPSRQGSGTASALWPLAFALSTAQRPPTLP